MSCPTPPACRRRCAYRLARLGIVGGVVALIRPVGKRWLQLNAGRNRAATVASGWVTPRRGADIQARTAMGRLCWAGREELALARTRGSGAGPIALPGSRGLVQMRRLRDHGRCETSRVQWASLVSFWKARAQKGKLPTDQRTSSETRDGSLIKNRGLGRCSGRPSASVHPPLRYSRGGWHSRAESAKTSSTEPPTGGRIS
jgi:hypothetical protein